MIKPNWKDVAVRAIKTFVQAFLGTLFAMMGKGAPLQELFTEASLIAALSAGLSTVWNGVINPALGVDNHLPDQ